MARKIYVDLSNSIESWRQKTNIQADYIGDLDNLTTDDDASIVGAINSIESKVISATGARSAISLVTSGAGTYTTLAYNSGTGQFSLVVNALTEADIPSLDGGKITGALNASQIPSLNASKINDGVLDAGRIPGLDASKIITGQFSADRIPSLSAGKITSGTIDIDRIPSIPSDKIFGASSVPYIDLKYNPDNADYDTRLIRNTTTNGTFDLIQKGTGGIVIKAINSAPIVFKTSDVNRIRIDSDGALGIYDTGASDWDYGASGEVLVSQGSTLPPVWGAGTPPGCIMAYAGSVIPTGWLECAGQAINKNTYPALYSAIGTTYGGGGNPNFRVPDLRGYFLRGWDNGRGIDEDRVFGSNQQDELKAHTHTYDKSHVITNGERDNNGQVDNTFDSTETSSTGGNETRPKNVAMYYIIKT
jgi:microcystin-dependent protein